MTAPSSLGANALYLLHSLPVYRAPELRVGALQHVLVTQVAALDMLQSFIHALPAEAGSAAILVQGEVIQTSRPARFCTSMEDLERHLTAVLSSAEIGLQLYLCGEEAFLWQLYNLARECGLQPEEIELVQCGTSRQVYCVHCATAQSAAVAAEIVCCQCGVQLSVREHFSRRLGAYMGVCANADTPYGEQQA